MTFSSHSAVSLAGVYRPRPVPPGFGIPVFLRNELLLVQEINANGQIDFVECEMDSSLLRPYFDRVKSLNFNEKLFAFEGIDGSIWIKSRSEMIDLLGSIVESISDYPFVLYEVAMFLSNRKIQEEALARCNELLYENKTKRARRSSTRKLHRVQLQIGKVLPSMAIVQKVKDFSEDSRFDRFSEMSSSFIDELGDDDLAELIEADGRYRISHGMPVTLERYIASVPDLLDRQDPLDAALDVTLRSISGTARPSKDSIDALIRKYPNLENPIREAAALSAAVWSTTGLRQQVSQAAPKALPCDFGPFMNSGQRRYVLQSLLGQGSFGQVYLARDRQLSEEGHTAKVAIKIISGGDRSPLGRQRIIDEATKVRRINHRNVVMVIDRGETENDEDYIVYEYVDGCDLGVLISPRERMDVRDAAKLVAQIALGVHAAHAAGVIHCDLKPGNIMVNSAGEPKVTSFEIVSQESISSEQYTEGPIGNFAFVSPEQYRGDYNAHSVVSDIYALGGILFLLLTGKLPNGSTMQEIALTHDMEYGRREAPQVRILRHEVDRDLEAICRRAIAVIPQHRYQSALSLAEDLDRWMNSEPLPWTQPTIFRRFQLWSRRKPFEALVVASLFPFGAIVGFLLRQLVDSK